MSGSAVLKAAALFPWPAVAPRARRGRRPTPRRPEPCCARCRPTIAAPRATCSKARSIRPAWRSARGVARDPFTLAAMKPGRMRTEMVSSTASMVAVCDGEHVYNYMPRLNQVHAPERGRARGDRRPWIGLAQALATGTPLERSRCRWRPTASGPLPSAADGPHGDRDVRCQGVEAQYGVVPGRHLEISPNRVWIDAARKLAGSRLGADHRGRPVGRHRDDPVGDDVLSLGRGRGAARAYSRSAPAGAVAELVEQPQERSSPLVGKAAHEFTLVDLDGYPRALSTSRARSCCSTSGPPGAVPAGGRCRRWRSCDVRAGAQGARGGRGERRGEARGWSPPTSPRTPTTCRCGWIVTVRSPGSTGDGVAHARHDRPRREGRHPPDRPAQRERGALAPQEARDRVADQARRAHPPPSISRSTLPPETTIPTRRPGPRRGRCAAPPGPARPWARSPA